MRPLPAPTAVIADDERLMREQIGARLKAWPELLIVGEASNGREAVAIVHSLEPDIVFLDSSMPEMMASRRPKRWPAGPMWSSSPPTTNTPSAPSSTVRSTIC